MPDNTSPRDDDGSLRVDAEVEASLRVCIDNVVKMALRHSNSWPKDDEDTLRSMIDCVVEVARIHGRRIERQGRRG